jgi:hypothetical protein
VAKFDVKKFAMNAVVPAVTINAAGFIEPKLEDYLSGSKNTGALSFLNSNGSYNKGGSAAAKNAKYIKVALYTGLGLVAQAAVQQFGDGEEIAEVAGQAIGTFLYGLSGATAAEDPYVPSPVFTPATGRQPAQKSYRNPVGSVIS